MESVRPSQQLAATHNKSFNIPLFVVMFFGCAFGALSDTEISNLVEDLDKR